MFTFDIFKKSRERLAAIKQQQSLAYLKQKQALECRKTEREVCAIIARGNVSLQRGEYITYEDMDTLQNELENYYSSKQSEW
ncbi:hypothetical protein FACS18942_09670 [Planctomycetales bacterium]|nr:hypothetical protein FACS18942_09670 [Planctomycetales bacterium]